MKQRTGLQVYDPICIKDIRTSCALRITCLGSEWCISAHTDLLIANSKAVTRTRWGQPRRSACGVCLLECLDPICISGTSLFWARLLELLLSGQTAPPDNRGDNNNQGDLWNKPYNDVILVSEDMWWALATTATPLKVQKHNIADFCCIFVIHRANIAGQDV